MGSITVRRIVVRQRPSSETREAYLARVVAVAREQRGEIVPGVGGRTAGTAFVAHLCRACCVDTSRDVGGTYSVDVAARPISDDAEARFYCTHCYASACTARDA
jgi:UDP-N-acetylmuramate-alanine ligase